MQKEQSCVSDVGWSPVFLCIFIFSSCLGDIYILSVGWASCTQMSVNLLSSVFSEVEKISVRIVCTLKVNPYLCLTLKFFLAECVLFLCSRINDIKKR